LEEVARLSADEQVMKMRGAVPSLYSLSRAKLDGIDLAKVFRAVEKSKVPLPKSK